MTDKWTFADVCSGLVVSDDGSVVRKPATEDGLQSVSETTMRSSHAFSARAGVQGGAQKGPATLWEATFRVRAQPGSAVLVGLAPGDTPLDTPLSWEHRDAYFVECSAGGAFLWSETAGIYGRRIAETCLLAAPGSDKNGVLSGIVNVQYGPHPPSSGIRFAVQSPNASPGLEMLGVGSVPLVELPVAALRPHVTILHASDSVALI